MGRCMDEPVCSLIDSSVWLLPVSSCPATGIPGGPRCLRIRLLMEMLDLESQLCLLDPWRHRGWSQHANPQTYVLIKEQVKQSHPTSKYTIFHAFPSACLYFIFTIIQGSHIEKADKVMGKLGPWLQDPWVGILTASFLLCYLEQTTGFLSDSFPLPVKWAQSGFNKIKITRVL